MRILRDKGRLLVIVLALAAVAGVARLALKDRLGAPPLVTDRLRDAADQRLANSTDQLIWQYQERVRRSPDDVNAYAMLGAAYVRKARDTGDPAYYDKAQAVFDEALKRNPQNVEALIGQGTLANARHQFRDALMIGERARALNPTIPRLYGVIADAQIELGMYDEAVQTLQTMIDMRPDLGSYSRAAYLRELHGDVQGAVELMAMAVRAGSRRDLEPLAWCLVQFGNLHFNQGRLAEAENAYQKALVVLPQYYQALAALGRVRGAQQRHPEAIDLYQQAIAIVPAPDQVAMLGDLLAVAGKPEEAERQYALVEYIEHVNETNQVTYNRQLALFYADHNRKLDEAVRLAEAELERRRDIYSFDTLAWVYYKKGRLADAGKAMEQASRLGTQDASLFFHAGMIAQALGDRDKAKDYLRRALDTNPYFSLFAVEIARKTLAELEQRTVAQGEPHVP